METILEKRINYVNSLSKRDLKKLYKYGSYCDIKTRQTISPLPKGYESKARERFGSLPNGGKIRVQLRTGRDEVV